MRDYTKTAATALRLVTKYGREVTLIDFNTNSADATKPWQGASNPRGGAVVESVVPAVFVPPSSATSLGLSSETSDFVKRSMQIMIVASTADLSLFNEVKDADDVRWKITGMEKLKPANTTILYFIGVKR